MKKHIILAAFALLCIFQFAAPFKMILDANNVKKSGTVLKFKCASFDPYDLFRGRYLHLNPRSFTVQLSDDSPQTSTGFRSTYYLVFEKDENGFANALYCSRSKPRDTSLYLKLTKTLLFARENSPNEMSFAMPFTKFFVNEKDADILDVFLNQNRRNQEDFYIEVAILNGKYAVMEFYDYKGRSSKQIVEEEREKTKNKQI